MNISFTINRFLYEFGRCGPEYFEKIILGGWKTWTLRATDQKYLESFEMWCWRRMEKISWTDHVRNEEVVFRVERTMCLRNFYNRTPNDTVTPLNI
jgi:hypothetical protein